MAYAAGKPIISDAEFDELKMRLKVFCPLIKLVMYNEELY
jgi:hypothetical protein